MIYLSSALTLQPVPPALDPNNGVIGWRSILTADMLEVTSEAQGRPATNLLTPSTNRVWRAADTGEQRILITVPEHHTDEIDFIGMVGANFAPAQIAASVLARNEEAEEFAELVHPVMRGDAGPVLFRFTPRSRYQVAIVMAPGVEPAEIAALYVGKLLILPRGIYVGHTPITDGLVVEESVGRSRGGRYLGTIRFGERVASSVSLANLDPHWYRQYMRPFIGARTPFFYAWRPLKYPREVGFVWFPHGHFPRPVNQRANGMMQIDFEIEGVAR